MKKGLVLLLFFIFCTQVSWCQTFSEWFRQKKTQIDYLIKQIGAYKVYADDLEKGYAVARQDLGAIRDFKKGEFNLDQNYFTSLSIVTPSIKKYSKIADIISMQVAIIEDMKAMLAIKNTSLSDLNYLKRVASNMNTECLKLINSLIDLTTNNSLAMKDADRIKMIDGIYLDMKDKYMFAQSFTADSKLLSLQRQNELDNSQNTQKLFP